MATIEITSTDELHDFLAWSAKTRFRGAAVHKGKVVFADRHGPRFAVRLDHRMLSAAMDPGTVGLEPEGGTPVVWIADGAEMALRLSARSGVPVGRLDWVRDITAAVAAGLPGTEVPTGYGSAVKIAALAHTLASLTDLDARQAALRFARQSTLWRTRSQAGWRVDADLLNRESSRVELERLEVAAEAGVDLTRNSPDVTAWLGKHGITITDKEGRPSLSRDDFDRKVVPAGSEAAWNLFRRAASLKSSMGKLGEFTAALEDGRVHSLLKVGAQSTGRTSTVGWTHLGRRRGVGLQNVPAPLRPLLLPDDGYRLSTLDFDRAELVLAADHSGDPVLRAELEGDVYLIRAEAFWGEKMTEDDPRRKVMKRTTLAVLYGAGAKTAAASAGCSEEQARQLIRSVKQAWRVLFQWMEEQSATVRRGEQLHTFTGRPLPLLPATKAYAAGNQILQGGCADALYVAVERVADRLTRDALYVAIHDELVIHTPEATAAEACSVLQECMTVQLPGGMTLKGKAETLPGSWVKKD